MPESSRCTTPWKGRLLSLPWAVARRSAGTEPPPRGQLSRLLLNVWLAASLSVAPGTGGAEAIGDAAAALSPVATRWVAASALLVTVGAALRAPDSASAQVAASPYDVQSGSGVATPGGTFPAGCGVGNPVTLVALGTVPSGSTVVFSGSTSGGVNYPCGRAGSPDMRSA